MFKRLKAAYKAYYEAGQPSERRRKRPSSRSLARFDASPAVLREIRESSEYHECNSPICNRIAGIYTQYTIGPFGMPIEPLSQNLEYGTKQSRWFDWWGLNCQVGSNEPIGAAQILSARTRFFSGECFIKKTKKAVSPESFAYWPEIFKTDFIPAIQLLETSRISSPTRSRKREIKNEINDGIELDKEGTPIAYWIAGENGSDHERVPATEIIHIVRVNRVGLKHGLPLTTPCINALNDLEDLQNAEMDAAKENARISKIVYNESGEPTLDELNEVTSSETLDPSNPSRKEYLQKSWGSETHYLKNNLEKYEQYGGERPTITTVNFWDYMLAQICAGMGMSKLLVLPFTLQGTVTRMDLDIADAFFWSEFAVYKTAWEEVWRWAQKWAQLYQPELRNPPKDWADCKACKPKSVNVDIKRNSQAALAEIEAGAMTFQEWYAENGQDWRKELRQRGIEIQYANDVGVNANNATQEGQKR